MLDSKVYYLAIAAAIGLVIGFERRWRGFRGSAPFHVAPALVGAYLVTRQTGLTALFWFLPLQILMWLIVIATVCMWSAERTPDGNGEFRGSGGLALSWSLAFLLGVACAFQAWLLLGCACGALAVFGLRTPRRIAAPASAVASTTVPAPAAAVPGEAASPAPPPESLPAAEPLQESGRREAVGGSDAGVDLKSVDGKPGRAAEPAIDDAFVKAAGLEALLQRPAA